MDPDAPGIKANEILKWWKPKNAREQELFDEARETLNMFLKSINQGILVDDIYDIIRTDCPTGPIRYKDFGFLTFNDFLFHCDELFDVRVDRTDKQYLFLRNNFDSKQQHVQNFVKGQRKLESDYLITRANTRDASTDILVRRDTSSWIDSVIKQNPSSKPTPTAFSGSVPKLRPIHPPPPNPQSTTTATVPRLKPRARAGSSGVSLLTVGSFNIPAIDNLANSNSTAGSCAPPRTPTPTPVIQSPKSGRHLGPPPSPSSSSISNLTDSNDVKNDNGVPKGSAMLCTNKNPISALKAILTKEKQDSHPQQAIKKEAKVELNEEVESLQKNIRRRMYDPREQPESDEIKKRIPKEKPRTALSQTVVDKPSYQILGAKLDFMVWIDCKFMGIDAYGFVIVKLENQKLAEYFESVMEKLNLFYSLPSNQVEYRMRADEITPGKCVVARVTLRNHTPRFIRAKVFSQERKGCILLGVDDFMEYNVLKKDVYHLTMEFSKMSARAIPCILSGTENRMMNKDLMRCLLRLQQRGHSLKPGEVVKIKVVKDKHPLYKYPVVEMKTKDDENAKQLLENTGEFFSFSFQNRSLTVSHLSTLQTETLKALEDRGYFFVSFD